MSARAFLRSGRSQQGNGDRLASISHKGLVFVFIGSLIVSFGSISSDFVPSRTISRAQRGPRKISGIEMDEATVRARRKALKTGNVRDLLLSRVSPEERAQHEEGEVTLEEPEKPENFPIDRNQLLSRQELKSIVNDLRIQNSYFRRAGGNTFTENKRRPKKRLAKNLLTGQDWILANQLMTTGLFADDPVLGPRSGKVAGMVKRIVNGIPRLVPVRDLPALRDMHNAEKKRRQFMAGLKERQKKGDISRMAYRKLIKSLNIIEYEDERDVGAASRAYSTFFGSELRRYGRKLKSMIDSGKLKEIENSTEYKEEKRKILKEMNKKIISKKWIKPKGRLRYATLERSQMTKSYLNKIKLSQLTSNRKLKLNYTGYKERHDDPEANDIDESDDESLEDIDENESENEVPMEHEDQPEYGEEPEQDMDIDSMDEGDDDDDDDDDDDVDNDEEGIEETPPRPPPGDDAMSVASSVYK